MIREYAKAGVQVKRFTYYHAGELIRVVAKKGEELVLAEDYFGTYSLIWIACITKDGEKWRHSVSNVARITYKEPIKINQP